MTPSPADSLRPLLSATRFRVVHHRETVGSTQDWAAERPSDGDQGAGGGGPEKTDVPALFWADRQTRGRGREGRAWDDGGDDIAVTFRVPGLQLPQPELLSVAVPVAIAWAVEPLLGRRVRCKWPNDVLVPAADSGSGGGQGGADDAAKIAGVLIDGQGGSPTVWLIGVGINGNRREFPGSVGQRATSLALETGGLVDRVALLGALAQELDRALRFAESGQAQRLLHPWSQRLDLLGRPVRVARAGQVEPLRGVLERVDGQGIHLEGGTVVPLAHTVRLDPDPS